ncbi:hypothetical protein HDIA_0549 [Hartmannibacter diazotrophicus]|uniref:Uncharacterized protein n=1 Tax=Hartmannibacter diazotrophicus TaxID=1482074 RepID=A0A2C9D1G5_9HYPH|nr:DUF6428 family protein [Hartmannibacter diazotrophicus]SON54090.1 hypothetical protein HDIA_0549 [Hartmannibacter diazotrophicus]
MPEMDNLKNADQDITLGDLLTVLRDAADLPLIFAYDGNPVRSGYHVTEVKAGAFAALDCGANHEEWSEIFIQLWDIDEGERTHMTAGKFSAIILKVADHVGIDPSARMTFEVSDGMRPMQLYSADAPVVRDGIVHVQLTPRPASCKPRDRWLAETASSAQASCCGTAASDAGCCAPTA